MSTLSFAQRRELADVRSRVCSDLHGEYQTELQKRFPKPGAITASGPTGLWGCNWVPAFYADLRGCADAKRVMQRHLLVCSACRAPGVLRDSAGMLKSLAFSNWVRMLLAHHEVCEACREGNAELDVRALAQPMELGGNAA